MPTVGKLKNDDITAIVDESDELRRLMRELGIRSKVVRSYVHNVMDLGMTTAEWMRKTPGMPGRDTWYKPASKGGKYWGLTADHNQLFRAAVAEYWNVMQRTRNVQHLRLSALAEKKMAEAVPNAADSMIKLSAKARNEQTKYNASRFLIQQRARAVDVADSDMWDDAEADAGDEDEAE